MSCPSGKLPYPNYAEAYRVAGVHNPKAKKRRLRAYQCEFCNLYHLTSEGKKDGR